MDGCVTIIYTVSEVQYMNRSRQLLYMHSTQGVVREVAIIRRHKRNVNCVGVNMTMYVKAG